MTTNVAMIAAEHQRARIPTQWVIEFDGMTNEELAYFAAHAGKPDVRAYCGWELEYREAFGFEVYYDGESDAMQRRRLKGAK